jgi:hypothetical protein
VKAAFRAAQVKQGGDCGAMVRERLPISGALPKKAAKLPDKMA